MEHKNISQIPTSMSIFKQENNNILLYSLEEVHDGNWEIFMWLASLDKIENFIYLFIMIWNNTSLQNNPRLIQEFINETDKMIKYTEELTSFKVLDNDRKGVYNNTLNDYKHSLLNNKSGLKNTLISHVRLFLENSGLKYSAFENQLNRLGEKKKSLRMIIFSRMNSFCSIARQVYTKGEQEKELLIEKNRSLKDQAETLVKENSRQQVALGNITNFSWNDEDPNSTTKLVSCIEDLQDKLSDFTMVAGIDYKINDATANILLKDNKCKVKYPSTEAGLVLGSLLQRYAIKIILEKADKYLKTTRSFGNDEPNDKVIEGYMANTTDRLIRYAQAFEKLCKGGDEITKVTPTKIRQHVYSALSCRGFPETHPLIKDTAIQLLNEMNRFRKVVDEETNEGLQEQAIQITRGVITLFRFRLKTQAFEPICHYFEPGQDIDTRFMQGAFGREDAKKLEVETCGFPCIGVFSNSDQKVLTKAQVIARPKRSGELINSMKNLLR